MNTIDMNQVAGLQAVDAEGNVIGTLSVDDLTNLVANNLVKSTQNQIAAQSVSTLSDASTLAASDEYENTLPVDDNPKSVRTLDAAGNPKQTGINALATVVGGLIKTNVFNPVDWGVFNVFYKGSTWGQNTMTTKISVNGKSAYGAQYISSVQSSSGDATGVETGVIRFGYDGNHATVYKKTYDTGGPAFEKNSFSVSVSEDGYLKITSNNLGQFLIIIWG